MSTTDPADAPASPGASGLPQWATLPFVALAWLSGALAAVMMVSTTVDVAGRYLFNRPLYGAFEITEISMGLIVFTALPLAVYRREMIVVGVLSDRYPERLRRLVDAVGLALGAALFGFVSWRMWVYGERLWSYRERTLELRVPKGLIVQAMSGLAAFAAVACVVAVVAVVAGRAARRHTDAVV